MLEQRSDGWFTDRLGKVTASCIWKVMARTKTGYGAERGNYKAQLITERLTGIREEGYVNGAMLHGIETEAQARAAYEFTRGVSVEEVGLVPHPAIAMCGASPDGLVGEMGLVEIKCPNTATHIACLQGAGIDRKYVLQMQWQMACTQRQWCDFASFDPRLPLPMQLHVERLQFDPELVEEIEGEVRKFLAEVDETVADLTARYLEKEAA